METAVGPAAARERAAGPVLEARGITKLFAGKRANDEVDFAARRGEVHAVLGENGAGKTTLICVLCGQYQPDAGTILVDGREVVFRSPREALKAGIGVVHQDFRLVARFTVLENVVLGTAHSAGRAAEARLRALVEEVGFAVDPRARVSELGVGQQQQVEILKLLYRGLDVLILDEPTAVLGPQQSAELFRSLRQLADAGRAVILITHKLREVTALADFVTVLRRGRVVASRPVTGLGHAELAELMVGERVGAAATPEPREPAEPVLTLTGARCAGPARDALADIDLVVRRGEIVGVAGVAGNGQVELAEVVAGVRALDGGDRVCHARTVAFIPEDRLGTGLVGAMAIAENLAFRRFRRPPLSGPLWIRRGRVLELARRLVERYRVPAADVGAPVGKLSGGGLQRVLVARELHEEPELLVAAQPTRGLDVLSAEAVRTQLVAARDRGAGVLLVSEDLDELTQLADRIVVLFEGRVVADEERAAVTRAGLGLAMAGGR